MPWRKLWRHLEVGWGVEETVTGRLFEKDNSLPYLCFLSLNANVKWLILKPGIDILVNNASAISLTGTLETETKKVNLMMEVNVRGTYLT